MYASYEAWKKLFLKYSTFSKAQGVEREFLVNSFYVKTLLELETFMLMSLIVSENQTRFLQTHYL